MSPATVYPHDLVDRLFGAIETLESEEPGRGAPPSREQLQRVLDAAWSATLLEEEGRRTVFTLAFVPAACAVRAQWRALPFADTTPCTPNAIAKLAIATDPRETTVAVQWSPGGELEIWGLLHLEDRAREIDSESQPHFVHVTGFRPGGLVVESHGRRVLLYMNGVAHWYESGAENIATLLRDTLHSPACVAGSTGAALAREFERLAERLVLAGQGGTLLITDCASARGVHVPATTTFHASDTCLRDAFLKEERLSAEAAPGNKGSGEHSSRRRFDAERAHLHALDHVARLSNVDGAVLMEPDLSVVGFGATIDLTDDTDIPPMDLHDLTIPGTPARSITVDEFQGHRHKSAVHFCAMQSDGARTPIALAIVASQDGSLSLFGRTGDRITVYRPFILRSVSVR